MSLATYDMIKKATVAIAFYHPEKMPDCPYTIAGSGFCIHQDGIIITCAHVFKEFFEAQSYQQAMQDNSGNINELRGVVPYVLFFSPEVLGVELHVFPVSVENAVSKNGFDLIALRVPKHSAFPNGYPTLSVEDYHNVQETMEIGTCGFPLGNFLQSQLGTITSSFTKGIVSSIIPAPNVPKEYNKGFQLDLTATNGNSGGPVFSLATGKVFGILQGGVVHPATGHVISLTKAETIYPILENDLINRLLQG